MADIRIQFSSGTLGEPTEQVFASGRVVVGRRRDCDVVLDPGHSLASGRHLILFQEEGRLLIEDLDSTNGTLVNGRLLRGRQALRPGDAVTAGPEGPVFTAELIGAGVDPLTTIDFEEPGMGDTVAIEEESATKIARIDSTGAGPPAPKSVGLETMTELVKSTVRRERRRGLVVAALALAVGAAGVHWLGGDGTEAAELERLRKANAGIGAEAGAARPDPAGFETVLASVTESVYVLVKRTERAGDSARVVESGSGTAWSIREGFLGTNAHVADLFAALGPGEMLIARSNASPPVDLRITGVRTHPGYAGFTSLVRRFRPYDKSSSEVLDLPPAYDVALLEIHPDDVASQAAPLKLASEQALYGLQAGQPIAFVGFPGEGLVRGGTDLARPSAKTAIGSLNRVIDPFFGRADDVTEAHCLEYNIEVVGGASGSPIVSASGEVIGLINAGDVISETSYGRVGTGGTSYGPRADTIQALVDGVAQEEWNRLRPGIEARMLEIFRDGSLESEEHAGQIGVALLDTVAATLDRDLEEEYTWTYKGRVELEAAGLGGSVTLDVPVGESGLRALIAIAEGVPLAIRLEGHGRVDRDLLLERTEGEESPSTVDLRLIQPEADDEVMRLDIRAEDDEYFAPAEVAVYLLRLD